MTVMRFLYQGSTLIMIDQLLRLQGVMSKSPNFVPVSDKYDLPRQADWKL